MNGADSRIITLTGGGGESRRCAKPLTVPLTKDSAADKAEGGGGGSCQASPMALYVVPDWHCVRPTCGTVVYCDGGQECPKEIMQLRCVESLVKLNGSFPRDRSSRYKITRHRTSRNNQVTNRMTQPNFIS